MTRTFALCPLALFVACTRPSPTPRPGPPAATAADAGLAAVEVTATRKDLVFSYVDADGGFRDVSSVDSVPETSRAQVLVRDLARSPEQLGAAEYLYVADVRKTGPDGRYPVSVVSRYSFERKAAQLGQASAVQAQVADGGSQVTVYGTSWCGVCAKTRAYLRDHGVAFLDKDVEKDPKAAADLSALAQRAGLRVQGVPVIDVDGQVLMGFDEAALTAALARHGGG